MKAGRRILILFLLIVCAGSIAKADEVSELIEELTNEDIFIRLEVIRALGEIADDRAIEPLVRALDDKDGVIRYSACRALGLIGGERVARELMKLARGTNPDRKQMAIIALGMVDDDTTIDFLLSQLNDANPQTRWAGVVALGMLGSKSALSHLEELMSADEYYIESVGRYPIREAAKVAIESINSSIDWHRSMERGLEVSRTSGKPLLAYFYIWWCRWSKLMESHTFSDEEVVKLMKKFVSVRINAYNESVISERYDVDVAPTIIVLDQDQKEIVRASGFVNEKSLLDKLNQVLDQLAKRSELMSWWDHANSLMDRGRLVEAIPYLENTVERDPENSSGISDDAKFVLAYCYGKKGRYREAIDEFVELLEEYPDYEKTDKALYCLGLSYLNLGRQEEGIKALELVITKYPDSKAAISANYLLAKLKQAHFNPK